MKALESNQHLPFLFFKQSKNSDVDILPFLKGASVSFQRYIIDGLAELDAKKLNSKDSDKKSMYLFYYHSK